VKDDKIDLISKDIEFVKDIVQDTGSRVSKLEDATAGLARDFHDHIATDREMGKDIARIGEILEKNTDSLIEHMRRTELNEASISELKNISLKLNERIQPLEISQIESQAGWKLWTKLGAIAGTIFVILNLIKTFFPKVFP
jgi:hypothetical protein